VATWPVSEDGDGPTPAAPHYRLLAGPRDGRAETLAAHRERLGPLLEALGRRQSSARIIDLVRRSGLQGRGGAGFPTAVKLDAVSKNAGLARNPVVVANGSETEPISRKDRVLLTLRPHLVLDGIEVAARAVGAQRAFLVTPWGAPEAAAAVRVALKERAAHLPGGLVPEVVTGSPAFVGGEETALLRWLEGTPPLPRFGPPRPFQRGWRGLPTLVQNVETLANLALISRFGADWFRSDGTDDEPGTTLVTVAGSATRPGVYELSIGTPLRRLLETAGWSPTSSALLLGGYFGTWVESQAALGALLSRAGVRVLGASSGAGIVQLLPEGACGLKETARLATWLALETSGQCGPCVRGLPAVAGAVSQLAQAHSVPQGLEARIGQWCDDIEGRGGCHHPNGFVNLVRSSVAVFAPELELHRRGRCSGTVTAGFPLPAHHRERR